MPEKVVRKVVRILKKWLGILVAPCNALGGPIGGIGIKKDF